ncbi:ubiquitinyl hydrolase 1 [Plakobranchus ocellatus]|uniref:Ubiquitinyl hydrolase 1 n=1 Tax=Plakobranchus ocellatus TaxID=259542 RepID=A0AAV4E335_9GAST|nr:ubiquitinyl hydrolase 1 [Plakobranchus ocellatus]
MELCPHIDSFTGPINESLLDPSRWQCSECNTTEWVWACLTCSNIGCGRMNEQHAEQHFCKTKHPLAVEINEKYVYCYMCDEYILGDNSRGDIAAIRSALTDIGTLSLEEVKDKGGLLLRSYSHQQEFSRYKQRKVFVWVKKKTITILCSI